MPASATPAARCSRRTIRAATGDADDKSAIAVELSPVGKWRMMLQSPRNREKLAEIFLNNSEH
jgi:hypothetical protein